jgi:hypothetical protein
MELVIILHLFLKQFTEKQRRSSLQHFGRMAEFLLVIETAPIYIPAKATTQMLFLLK